MEETTGKYNKMQQVKRRMFAMRNGIIADTMRKAGAPFRIVFGLNLPQIADMAREFGPDAELAEQLWANVTTRESKLLAPMLVDAEAFTIEDACRWLETVPCTEVADVLCLKLLRRLPYAMEIVDRYSSCDTRMHRYTALRLMCNLGRENPEKARRLADAEMQRGDDALAAVALRLSEF